MYIVKSRAKCPTSHIFSHLCDIEIYKPKIDNSELNYVAQCVLDYCKVEVCASGYCRTNRKDDPLRKPNTGMFDLFRKRFKFDLNECLMVGDASGSPGQFSDSDKKAAENFGIDYLDVSDFVKLYSF